MPQAAAHSLIPVFDIISKGICEVSKEINTNTLGRKIWQIIFKPFK